MSARRWREVRSEDKQGAAPRCKGGYGFHPMMCLAGGGEPLWVKLRSGDVADRVEVLDAAISVLPDEDAAGRRAGDAAALGGREMVLRAPAAARRVSLRHAGTAA
ncbi:hypothetical protein [Candidatus Poriferisodalis sp.]|uniref:hypothetical protein n=1 Tax=Candidatus Poriferisodalis sp. TaxID=3101277 RepID=UPI003B02A0ED